MVEVRVEEVGGGVAGIGVHEHLDWRLRIFPLDDSSQCFGTDNLNDFGR